MKTFRNEFFCIKRKIEYITIQSSEWYNPLPLLPPILDNSHSHPIPKRVPVWLPVVSYDKSDTAVAATNQAAADKHP